MRMPPGQDAILVVIVFVCVVVMRMAVIVTVVSVGMMVQMIVMMVVRVIMMPFVVMCVNSMLAIGIRTDRVPRAQKAAAFHP
jgi:hypothetical protein